LARIVKQETGIDVDPESLFDVQVKRIHEYKRQLMNCLHVVALYRRIKLAGADAVPRTVLFGGKAAPGYAQAKMHIKLINDVASIVNGDPAVRGRLRCVFLPNYRVSLAERIIPAADLSEQISMAGKEASGTGNMKFQMNGALTIGTLDGANVEIRDQVGADNFFLFGLDAEHARALKDRGYDPAAYIAGCEELRDAIGMIEDGFFSPGDRHLHRDVVGYLRHADPYLICADFADYIACQERAAAIYRDNARWHRMVVKNIAHAGKFSSDRSIRDYAADIWHARPVHVTLEPYAPPA
jgi:starch phosphorylase